MSARRWGFCAAWSERAALRRRNINPRSRVSLLCYHSHALWLTDMQTSLTLVIASAALYLAAAVFYFAALSSERARRLSGVGSILLLLGILVQLYWFIARTVEYWRQYHGFVLPSVSAFEAIALMAFLIAVVYYATELTSKTRAFGGLVLLVPLAAMAYLVLLLPDQSGPRDLPPALKSYWLPTHIGTLILAYAVFSIAFILAVYYLFRLWRASAQTGAEDKAALARIDRAIYTLTLAGYPFLTLGLFLGAVWANEAWGTYWAWDPKETWALVTWVFYTMYFHARLSLRWQGALSQALNISAYAVLLTTFIGVDLISAAFGIESIHAYATTKGGLLGIIGLFVFIAVPLVYALWPRVAKEKPQQEPDAKGSEAGLWELFVGLLKSIPSAVAMLAIFGILCIIGTLIPQRILGAQDAQLIAKFGESGFKALEAMGLTDIFRTWYFDLVFFWLALAALICTLARLRGVRADLKSRPGAATAASILGCASAKRICASEVKLGLDEFIAKLRARRYRVFTSEAGGAMVIQADRWALRKYMPVIFHAAILAIFLGGAIGRVWGYSSAVTVPKGGEVVETFRVSQDKEGLSAKLASLVKAQSYELKLRDFTIEYNKRAAKLDAYADIEGSEAIAEFESYEIRHFISDLVVSHNGHEVQGQVVVNHPLRAGVTTFYQTSYMKTGYVTVSFDGQESTYHVRPGYAYQVGPDGELWEADRGIDPNGSEILAHPEPIGGTFPVKSGPLYESGIQTGQLGPIGLFHLISQNGTPLRFVLLTPDKPLELTIPGHKVTVRMDGVTEDVSVFQYKQDPGVWLVFTGWMALIAALLITAFITFARIEAYWGEDGVVVRARTHGPRPADAFAKAIVKTLTGGR